MHNIICAIAVLIVLAGGVALIVRKSIRLDEEWRARNAKREEATEIFLARSTQPCSRVEIVPGHIYLLFLPMSVPRDVSEQAAIKQGLKNLQEDLGVEILLIVETRTTSFDLELHDDRICSQYLVIVASNKNSDESV